MGWALPVCVPNERVAEGLELEDFLRDHGVLVALVCAGLAVVYGAVTSRQLLALSPGNERMREISGAIQAGARAYLNRQYTVIGGIALVLFVVLIFLLDIEVPIGILTGGIISRCRGELGMNVAVRANARVAEV